MKFGRLSDLVNNGKALRKNRALSYCFKTKRLSDFIIELNTHEQLFNEGVDRNGEIVGRYSKKTERLYAGQSFGGKQKIAGEKYFFLATGDLFRSFSLVVGSDSITIIATDVEKLADVIEDPALLVGLTEDSKYELIKETMPIFREYIIKQLLK